MRPEIGFQATLSYQLTCRNSITVALYKKVELHAVTFATG
jgi:hypothetical protein